MTISLIVGLFWPLILVGWFLWAFLWSVEASSYLRLLLRGW
jgi:hypothetical protein